MPQVEATDIDLDPDQEAALVNEIEQQLSAALATHVQRERKIMNLRRAYRALPEHEKKNFPWDGASNVVIPIVGITVDNVVARLMRAFMGTQDLVECTILDPQLAQPNPASAGGSLEKDFRDWATMFFDKSGARDRLRTGFHDMSVDGTIYMKVRWDSKTRVVHAYGGGGGEIVETQVVDYEGPVWDEISSPDCIFPEGFDEWSKLPWVANRIRFTWQELCKTQADGMYSGIDDSFKATGGVRQDPAFTTAQEVNKVKGENTIPIYELYEIWGTFEVPKTATAPVDTPPQFEQMILTYSRAARKFVRKIYNPFFGRPIHIVRIPFLHMPHQIDALGVAEQVISFQEEAGTAHNQTIDAATAAIAGIVVVRPGADVDSDIYPGKKIVTDNPREDVAIVHLSMGNSTLPSVEQSSAFWAEKRSGVNSYSMGVESPVAGSRATATGTTALLNEGNLRYWVSIDDMRDSIVSLLYLTLQLEQQIRPEGTPITATRMLQLPQGDLREIFGLRLQMSSEKVNRDIEVQNFQVLITILNDYYARLMQLGGVLLNPQFPPQQKMLAMAVMDAANKMMVKFVERFDVDNINELVPGIQQVMQIMQAGQSMGGGQPPAGPQGAIGPGGPGGPSPMAGPPPGNPGPGAPGPGGGAPQFPRRISGM